ncbi:MAG: hypothetical protein ACYCZF_13870 [Anaerolineae bacterium]
MARARNWETLSPVYRKRLQRGGVTKKQYNSGANLQAARGQKIEARRTVQRREQGLPSMATVRKQRAAKATGSTATERAQWARWAKELKAVNMTFGGMTPEIWNAAVKKYGRDKVFKVAAARANSYAQKVNNLTNLGIEDWPREWGWYNGKG